MHPNHPKPFDMMKKEDDNNQKLSKKEIKRNEVYERALTNGAKIEHHPTFGAWKMEMGKKKEPLHQQMALRRLSYNSNTTIAAMINKIMEFDKK